MASHPPFHVTPDSGRPLPAAGGVLLADRAATGGGFTLIHGTVPPGDRTPLHRHRDEDESFLVRSGGLTVTCGDEVYEVAAGGFVHLPRGVPHRYVAGPSGADLLILATPAGLETFFDDLAAGVDPDELSRRHGVVFLDEPGDD